jgi:hypothetical protein
LRPIVAAVLVGHPGDDNNDEQIGFWNQMLHLVPEEIASAKELILDP